jgi:hypothetical protein
VGSLVDNHVYYSRDIHRHISRLTRRTQCGIVLSVEVAEILNNVRQRVSELDAERGHLQAQLAKIEHEMSDLLDEERVLRRIAERYDLPPVRKEAPVPQEVREWRNMPRTVAVERVLAQSRTPLSPVEIHKQLRINGRDDEAHLVSAALAHLKRAGQATQVSRGAWVRTDRHELASQQPLNAQDSDAD